MHKHAVLSEDENTKAGRLWSIQVKIEPEGRDSADALCIHPQEYSRSWMRASRLASTRLPSKLGLSPAAQPAFCVMWEHSGFADAKRYHVSSANADKSGLLNSCKRAVLQGTTGVRRCAHASCSMQQA